MRTAPRVLVADAQPEAALLLRTNLEADGFSVEQVGDGRQALQRALFHPPSLVVADFHLPFISGPELCEILRRDRSTSSTPLIILADEQAPDSLQRARSAADAVVIKPVDPAQLIADVRALLDRRSEAIGRSRQVRAKLRLAIAAAAQLNAPDGAPVLRCPTCNTPLLHLRTHSGGVGPKQERWDEYRCPRGCGEFDYRHRTGRIRRIG